MTSQILPSRLRLFRRAIASYLQTYYGPNDGIVVLRDQSLSGIGTDLGVFDAGHTDLTHRFPATSSGRVRPAPEGVDPEHRHGGKWDAGTARFPCRAAG